MVLLNEMALSSASRISSFHFQQLSLGSLLSSQELH